MASRLDGLRLRPMGVGDLLDMAIVIYRRRFLLFVLSSAIAVIPSALLSLAVTLGFGLNSAWVNLDDTSIQPARLLILVAASLAIGLLAALANLLSFAAAIRLSADVALGAPTALRAAYQVALTRIVALTIAILLPILGLMIAGLGVVFAAALALMVNPVFSLLVWIVTGIPALIGASYFWLGWSVASQAIVLEQRGPLSGLARSSALVRGNRWRVLGIGVLLALLLFILVSMPSMLANWAFLMLGGVTRIGPELLLASQVLGVFVSSIAQSLFGALGPIALTLLYFDLRVRKEAFDLERLAALPAEVSEKLPAVE